MSRLSKDNEEEMDLMLDVEDKNEEILQPPGYSYSQDNIQPPAAPTHSSMANTTVVVNQPVTQHVGVINVERPRDYFILSFLAFCLCSCCWPAVFFGAMGMIYSVQVTNQWNNKDYEGASKSSFRARVFSALALVFGLITILLYILLFTRNLNRAEKGQEY